MIIAYNTSHYKSITSDISYRLTLFVSIAHIVTIIECIWQTILVRDSTSMTCDRLATRCNGRIINVCNLNYLFISKTAASLTCDPLIEIISINLLLSISILIDIFFSYTHIYPQIIFYQLRGHHLPIFYNKFSRFCLILRLNAYFSRKYSSDTNKKCK